MIPAHQFVGDNSAARLAVLMHGVLGAGHNLRSFAKQLVAMRPEYRIALVDLRYHGKSLGAPPPHRLDSCVDDLLDLVDSWGRAPDAVLGHSMGGKIALRYAARHESPANGQRLPMPTYAGQLKQVWTLDSDPGAQEPGGSHEVQLVMNALRAQPGPFPSRADAVAALVGEGRSSGLANWLATSLDRKPEGLVWRYDLDPIEELLKDYFALDLWPFLENTGDRSAAIEYELLVAENSDRWSGSMKERATNLASTPRVRPHTLPNSGHWVHVDNPSGLLEIVTKHLV